MWTATPDRFLTLWGRWGVHRHALWLWLVGLATYKVWGYLKPYMFPEPDGPMDPSTKKR